MGVLCLDPLDRGFGTGQGQHSLCLVCGHLVGARNSSAVGSCLCWAWHPLVGTMM